MKKINLFITLFLLLTFLLSADDIKNLSDVEADIKKAKVELLKWDKTHQEDVLILAIEYLKTGRSNMLKIKDNETIRFSEVNKELTMLYFWANKSKRVDDVSKEKKNIDQYKKSIEEVAKENKSETNAKNEKHIETVKAEEPNNKENKKSLKELVTKNNDITENIVIPVEHFIITIAFEKAIEFSKNNPHQLYECEFMFRDIYYDFPTSKSAILANEIADKYSLKIENFVKEKLAFRNSIQAKIPNYEENYNARNYGAIIDVITELKINEPEILKQDIYWEMLEEYKYLQTAIFLLNELLVLNKNDLPPASLIGINFRGFISSSDAKGIIVTTDMGTMSIPWVKVSDEQLGKLLAVLSKNHEISYKIPIAIHLLGNTQDAFQLLYKRSLDNPIVMAKYSRFYFQTLFYFRKEMAIQVDNQIENALKLFNNKDTSGAIGVLTKSLLNINKNNFLRDQIGKIHSAIMTFNN